jgi:hypothetical protein
MVASAALHRKTGAAFRSPDLHVPASTFTAATAEPPMQLFSPLDTAFAGHQLHSGDAAKLGICSFDTAYSLGAQAATCRVYMYPNPAGTAYDIYTGWFVDSKHVVTAGSAFG